MIAAKTVLCIFDLRCFKWDKRRLCTPFLNASATRAYRKRNEMDFADLLLGPRGSS
jgi:hypothetical protein